MEPSTGDLDLKSPIPVPVIQPREPDNPAAVWWWLVPLAILLIGGMMDWSTKVEVGLQERIALDRLGTLTFWCFLASGLSLLFGDWQGTVWKSVIHCWGRWTFLGTMLAWAMYSQGYSRRTVQIFAFTQGGVDIYCNCTAHPLGAERNITKVGGFIVKTYKGKSKESDITYCKPCMDDLRDLVDRN